MSKEIGAAHVTGNAPPDLNGGTAVTQNMLHRKSFSFPKSPEAKKILRNERGEANYFSAVVFILIAVLLLAFIIDLFGIISTKQQLDHCADQMVKQIQLSGEFHIVDSRLGYEKMAQP